MTRSRRQWQVDKQLERVELEEGATVGLGGSVGARTESGDVMHIPGDAQSEPEGWHEWAMTTKRRR